MRVLMWILMYALLPPAMAAGAGATRVDPTRPVLGPVSGGGTGTGQHGVTSAAEERTDPTAERPSLVLVSPKRTLALMNGQLLRPGDAWGESRVLRIGLQGLWLRAADGSEILLRQAASDKRRIHPGPRPTMSGESR